MRRTACTQPCPPQVSGLGSCLCALLSATGAGYLFEVLPVPLEFAGSDHNVVEGTVGASAQRQSDPYRHPSLLLLQQLYCRWPHGRHFADRRGRGIPTHNLTTWRAKCNCFCKHCARVTDRGEGALRLQHCINLAMDKPARSAYHSVYVRRFCDFLSMSFSSQAAHCRTNRREWRSSL